MQEHKHGSPADGGPSAAPARARDRSRPVATLVALAAIGDPL